MTNNEVTEEQETMSIIIEVPVWAKYKAQFSNGQWFLFENKPTYDGWGGWDNTNNGQMMAMLLESNLVDAENSLTAVYEHDNYSI